MISDEEPRHLQVLAVGMTYRDVVMTGLETMPRPGEEIYASALHETWGGVATMARVCNALGLTTGLATAVGDDAASARLLDDMSRTGVDTSLTARHPDWALPVTVALSTPDDRAMVTVETPPPAGVTDHLEHRAFTADAVIVDMRDPAADWLDRARAQGAKVYASRGFDPTGEWSADSLAADDTCDVWMLNDLEARAFTGLDDPLEAARKLSARVPMVVVTRGAAGMVGVDAGSGDEASVDAFRVHPQNLTGAGDSTLAALAYAGLVPGTTLTDRLELAAFIAGAILERPQGAAQPPSLDELVARTGSGTDARLPRIRDLLAGGTVR